jgi:hypothetical protein
MNLVITLRPVLDKLCKIQHSCFCPGREMVANLFSRGIDESGVAAEGVSRIAHGFLVISTWTHIEVV